MAPFAFTKRPMMFRGFGEFKVMTTKSDDPDSAARWTQDRGLVDRRIRRWREKHDWCDKTAERFGLSRAYYEDDRDEDAAWQCVDLLGKGAFGMVGKWCKFDKNGAVVKTIAIKQFEFQRFDAGADGRIGIPGEAAIPYGLDLQGCKRTAEVRKMKFFDTGRPKFRLYLSYYSHGSLGDMIKEYRGRSEREQRPVHMPEEFIWQAFDDFADVYNHMTKFRLSSLGLADHRDRHYVLHLDIKPDNVLLGEGLTTKGRYKRFLSYPTVRVADWGLSEVTNRRDGNNSFKLKNGGTPCFMPPEQYDYNRWAQNWGRNPHGDADRPYTTKHSLWQMAACIYGAMELEWNNKTLERLLRAAEKQQDRTRNNQFSLIPNYRTPHYSPDLCKLVEDCLNIRPEFRPEPDELQRRITRGMEPGLRKFERTGKRPSMYMSKMDVDYEG